MYFGGVDIGSTTTKAVVIDDEGSVLGFSLADTTSDRSASGEAVLATALGHLDKGFDDLSSIGATGYGRRVFDHAQTVVPEVICHARGTEQLIPGVRTVIDIGGQDSKVIECQSGLVMKFEMNDKCAAGSGRFFEVLSRRLLNVTLDELGPMALRAEDEVRLSSICTVYAESEIVSMLSNGVSRDAIAKGILVSVFRRIVSMANQSGVAMKEPIVLSGGVAKSSAAIPLLEELLGKTVTAVPNPQLPAALGAALLAQDAYYAARTAEQGGVAAT